MPLELVPPTPPDRKTALVERIKDIERPDGMVQCSRCGGRDTLTIRNGDRIEGGRVKAGTVVEKGICPHCWKQGVIVDLIQPKLRAVAKLRPRHTKPKIAVANS